MAKIKITLVDEENGHVKIVCDPSIPKLLEIAKAGMMTAAEAYAMAGLRKMFEDSQSIENEKAHDHGLVTPDNPRFKMLN